MLALGSLLALLSGTFNATAAALEKREGQAVATGRSGLALLAALARRPAWLLAMALSAVAWVAEAAALAIAPVPVVATLRNAGRGLLVAAGGRWLNERFTRLELVGVALASGGGAITALGAAKGGATVRPLSNLTGLVVAVACVLGAVALVRTASYRTARHRGPLAIEAAAHCSKTAGMVSGAAVGLLFAGTGVLTKEIGDRFAVYGTGGFVAVLASTSPWLMIAMSVFAQSLLQQAFRRANAASVSAINASVASLGLITAGFVLYSEKLPGGMRGLLLVGGVFVSLAGTALLLGSRPGRGDRAAAGTRAGAPRAAAVTGGEAGGAEARAAAGTMAGAVGPEGRAGGAAHEGSHPRVTRAPNASDMRL